MSGEILSDRQIKELISSKGIKNADPDLVNPGSLDLRLGTEKWKLLASTPPLPGQLVRDMIENPGVVDVGNDTKEEFYLDKNQPYLFKLIEEFDLIKSVSGLAFNKSKRGRVGTSVRVLCDGVPRFDYIPRGYKGPLYAEITATAFPEVVSSGIALPQVVFFDGDPQPLRGVDLELLLMKEPILLNNSGKPFYTSEQDLAYILSTGKLTFTADLSKKLLLYKAKQDARTLDLRKKDFYYKEDFFEEVRAGKRREYIVHPGEFVLVHSKQNIRLPPTHAMAIPEYSPEIGDVKSHYAGWINPGHGYTPSFEEDHIVFEVRPRDVPFFLCDGKPLAQSRVYRMAEEPQQKYTKKRSTSFESLESILPSQFKKTKT